MHYCITVFAQDERDDLKLKLSKLQRDKEEKSKLLGRRLSTPTGGAGGLSVAGAAGVVVATNRLKSLIGPRSIAPATSEDV